MPGILPAGGPPWPVELVDGELVLRPLRRGDGRAWRSVRAANADWLRPWEATSPEPGMPAPTFRRMAREAARAARRGQMLPFVMEVEGCLAGQVTVSGISWGSLRTALVGYWVDQRVAGRGLTPRGVAMATDHCFAVLGLHRVEIDIRPENAASLRVVDKLGFVEEGMRRGLLHIDGAWRDHRSFALLSTDVPTGGLLASYHREFGRHAGRGA